MAFITPINSYTLIFTVLMLIQVFETVLITEFKVPEVVNHGSDVELLCKYDLQEDEVLYTIKWYKEETEFYRYEPREWRQVSYFKVPGINIDKERSNYTRIILLKVNNETSGNFVCEVSVDITFTTAMREQLMFIKSSSLGQLFHWPLLMVILTLINLIIQNCYQLTFN
ncbi:uncharacterized protein LOC107360472 [Tetranychus urticae]|uniref:Ig-like domain-containing protein n=1 Tax=Tetranychus urticae TaxID=32264 RepID=T1JTQ5_TETUR|nr:uncharacterized protein LOC107360472 [Tetranychus urticae]